MKESELQNLLENLNVIFRSNFTIKYNFTKDVLTQLKVNYSDILRTAQLDTILQMANHYNWSLTIGRSGAGLKIEFTPNKLTQ